MSDKLTVVEALIAVMAEVQQVGKGQVNRDQGYRFRGVDDVVNAVGPVLRKHGVLPVPLLEEMGLRDVRTSRDKPARESTVKVRYRFYGPAGDSIDAVVPGESMDFGDKGIAKAMSVAYRIVLLQALCIPTDEPDPDSHTYEREREPAGQEAIDLFAVIMDARDEAALRLSYQAVVEAENEGRISSRESAQLNAHIKKRKAEMEAAVSQPSAPDETVDDREPPPSAGDRHRRRAFALFPKVGLTDDAARHEYAARVLGRAAEPSFSFKTLTGEDWKKLADTMAGLVDKMAVADALALAVTTEGGS